jgi:hypothetical protein
MLVKFEIYSDREHWCARGIGVDIFTQGDTMDELVKNLKEAVEVHFGDQLHTGEEIKILSMSEIEISRVYSPSIAPENWAREESP